MRSILARRPGVASSDFDLNADQGGLSSAARLRPAAVLVGLLPVGGDWHVVLTKRTAALVHHPGQVAFPGGKQEPGEDPVAAALREADEEIGLSPAQVTVIGSADPHQTITGFDVTPIVATIAPGFTARPDPSEVAEVFTVPLTFLLDPTHTRIEGRTWKGAYRRYYTMPYGPYYIWGATARILVALQSLWGRR